MAAKYPYVKGTKPYKALQMALEGMEDEVIAEEIGVAKISVQVYLAQARRAGVPVLRNVERKRFKQDKTLLSLTSLDRVELQELRFKAMDRRISSEALVVALVKRIANNPDVIDILLPINAPMEALYGHEKVNNQSN